MKSEGRSKKLKFKLEDYPGEVCMHCNTEEKAEKFCMFLHENGRTWRTGVSYSSSNNFYSYKDRTCYFFNDGQFGCVYSEDNISDYKTLEFDDFDWED